MNLALQQSPNAFTQPHAPEHRVTELIIPWSQQSALLLPMLRFLGNEDDQRWLTIISHGSISQAWLRQQGLNPRSIRVIRADSPESALWMTWEALAAGNSHTVVAEINAESAITAEMEQAASIGNCRALLVKGNLH
ncbi:cell division inhibitor-related protein, SulA-like protein [Simiduia agarivorans SA1 = DSM 21679]|uniref:SulA n=2 Tax=Simiduia TaxID=447467 RepID=H8YHZ0_SIMAS|nr:SulA [Simiduia agarivorans SA1 = DSM 21679]AFU97461.1 cell division inhibitor-related protein, SulA-like protein [Simiduia agarivorans SA1 = DSM 21679]